MNNGSDTGMTERSIRDISFVGLKHKIIMNYSGYSESGILY